MKRALLASYATQIYVGLIGLVLMPVYLRYMGAEAFGLVGLFVSLQAWLQLLDLGLSPSLSREMSLYCAGMLPADLARGRLRSLECLLGGMAVLAVLGLATARDWIAHDWLNVRSLSVETVSSCLVWMGGAAAARWLAGLYRAGLAGMERQLSVNAAVATFSTLKFVGVIPLLAFWTSEPRAFFAYQALIGGFELVTFAALMYHILPRATRPVWPSWSALRGMLPVAGAMAFLSGMWVFLTQIDKLILSRALSLEVFGYYSVAVAAAGSVLTLVPPLNQVLLPRMTILAAQGRTEDLKQIFCMATQCSAVVFTATGAVLAILADPVLWVWTGSRAVADQAAPILFWYGLANGLIGVLTLPFMLQFAFGYLRLHIVGNLVLGLTLLPALGAAATYYGAKGAGGVLFAANLMFLLFWIPLVYRKLMPDLTWRWLGRELMPPACATLLVVVAFAAMMPMAPSRIEAAGLLIAAVSASALAGVAAGNRTRALIATALFRKTMA
ncbi:lipopolysaccharide biosynthesis protein [Azoarcus sp. KH32C]|uniref:lipopolysaccharide biosynthesis protein n=1 Tax=Azoarcus sp. KH32C TaxID=748247 RepID=UPI0005A00BE4|nr:oligosaccharide flippase family protein [Azoarcus sp. KH32C]